MGEKTPVHEDRRYTHEEIHTLLNAGLKTKGYNIAHVLSRITCWGFKHTFSEALEKNGFSV